MKYGTSMMCLGSTSTGIDSGDRDPITRAGSSADRGKRYANCILDSEDGGVVVSLLGLMLPIVVLCI